MIKNVLSFVVLCLSFQPVFAERIKDLVSVSGARSNQLVGYGLVVGLNGTGDQSSQTPYTTQSLKAMLGKLGISIPAGVSIQPKNVAAVMISAELLPFAKVGQTFDVTVSSVANAKSLRGGTLLMSSLRGGDGNVYAVAQGNLVVGGLSADGRDGSNITVNNPSSGRIPNGATVERASPSPFSGETFMQFDLHTPDFTTAQRVADTINREIGPGMAIPMDATSIRVQAPSDAGQKVGFLSVIENLEVQSAEAPAKVIVNSRTGTVVIGTHVRVKPAAIAHGNMTVTITERPTVNQPGAFSDGDTATEQSSTINIKEGSDRMFVFDPGVTLSEIVNAVNQVGASPSDLVAILEALKQSGSLGAELIII